MKPSVIFPKSQKLESFPAMRMLVLQGKFCYLYFVANLFYLLIGLFKMSNWHVCSTFQMGPSRVELLFQDLWQRKAEKEDLMSPKNLQDSRQKNQEV